MPDRPPPKALRVIAGTLLMAGLLAIAFSLVLQYAGRWGVPYFSFVTDRGSTCRNNLTGYICQPVTLREVEFHSDVDLPDNTRVRSGVYTATHDYTLTAYLRVPRESSAAALAALNAAFGPCLPNRPSRLDPRSLAAVCVMANDDAIFNSGDEVDSRLYVVGTGVRRDGSRDIDLAIRSR